MKFINNENQTYITDQAEHPIYKDITARLKHMVTNGYGSITIDNTIASFDHEEEVDGEKIFYINVGGES